MTSDGIGPKGPGGGLDIDRGTGGEIGDEAASVIGPAVNKRSFDGSEVAAFCTLSAGSEHPVMKQMAAVNVVRKMIGHRARTTLQGVIEILVVFTIRIMMKFVYYGIGERFATETC